jgi:hypothetical protein
MNPFSLHVYNFFNPSSHTLRNLNDWTIQLGMTRRHSHAHYGQKIKVKRVIPHPQYNDFVAHDNDIALFQVSSTWKRKKPLKCFNRLLLIQSFAARHTRRISRSFIARLPASTQHDRARRRDQLHGYRMGQKGR